MRSVFPTLAATAVAAALLLAGQVMAQGTVSTARPAPPEAASLTAPVLEGPPVRIPQARLELARRVYDLIGPVMVGSTIRSMTTSMSLQFANAMDDRTAERAKAIVAAVGDGMNSITPQITDAGVSTLARNFTDQQLQDMAAFYSTPTGHAVILKMPLISSSATRVMVEHLPEMMSGVKDSFCSRVKCSSRERKALDGVAGRLAAARPAE
jgi:hypothetical protein